MFYVWKCVITVGYESPVNINKLWCQIVLVQNCAGAKLSCHQIIRCQIVLVVRLIVFCNWLQIYISLSPLPFKNIQLMSGIEYDLFLCLYLYLSIIFPDCQKYSNFVQSDGLSHTIFICYVVLWKKKTFTFLRPISIIHPTKSQPSQMKGNL